MSLKLRAGTTSKTKRIFIADSSSTVGAGLTGLTNASSGLTAYYHREGASGETAISIVSATLGTWTSGGFVEVDATNMPGWYEIGIPNAAIASGADAVGIMYKGATNMVPVNIEIDLSIDAEIEYVNGQAASATGAVDFDDLGTILTDTNELQTDWTNGGRLDLIIDELTTNVDTLETKIDTIDGIADSILVDTGTTLPGLLATIDTQVDTIRDTDLPNITSIVNGNSVDIGVVDGIVDSILVDTGTTLPAILGTPSDLGSGATVGDNLADMAGGTFNSSTDSQESIYNAVTGLSSASAPQLLQTTTIATLASQTSFTLTAGSADDDAYTNVAYAIFTDQATSTQKSVVKISDYVGSTKTVSLANVPAFTIATGDTVSIVANVTPGTVNANVVSSNGLNQITVVSPISTNDGATDLTLQYGQEYDDSGNAPTLYGDVEWSIASTTEDLTSATGGNLYIYGADSTPVVTVTDITYSDVGTASQKVHATFTAANTSIATEQEYTYELWSTYASGDPAKLAYGKVVIESRVPGN